MDRRREREDLRDLLRDRIRGREDLRDDRIRGREDLRDLLADRIRGREDLRDLLGDRLERRALLRELLTEHVRGQEGRLRGLASERLENAAEEGPGATAGVSRDDLRDLILDRIHSRRDVDQLLEQIRDRIDRQE